jgi:H2-forming N5,N10-methylenetetrahydromethanopterin dehydrogenase-like enzyme
VSDAALQCAREYGVAVTFNDLGDWGRDELRSEYDPHGPTIRINARVVDALPENQRGAFVATAIGHELYHHRERIGEVARETDRAARERNADAFARGFAERA